jgi:hypothetical protein
MGTQAIVRAGKPAVTRLTLPFAVRNAEFLADLAPLTQRVGRSAFSRPSPKALYHYTGPDTAEKIIATRSVWATCVTEQKDLTELHHGIAVVERIAMDLIDKEPNFFVRRILAGLPEYMRNRRSMIFITCFCGTEASEFHLNEYGSVCFKFNIPNGQKPSLECSDFRADSWYSPVIYGERNQIKAVKVFLTEVSRLLVKHSDGRAEDDTGGWLASGPMRDIGQCLLTIVSCFKREHYKRDSEWRLIFAPNLALSYSAPKMIDDEFSTCIVDQPRWHICLRRHVPFIVEEGCIWPPDEHSRGLPFDEIIRDNDAR